MVMDFYYGSLTALHWDGLWLILGVHIATPHSLCVHLIIIICVCLSVRYLSANKSWRLRPSLIRCLSLSIIVYLRKSVWRGQHRGCHLFTSLSYHLIRHWPSPGLGALPPSPLGQS